MSGVCDKPFFSCNNVPEQRTDLEIVQKCVEWGKNALQPFYCECKPNLMEYF